MMDIEVICEAVHKAYCDERIRQGKEPYWTGGDYNNLSEAVKDYDRATVRAVLAFLDEQPVCKTCCGKEAIKEAMEAIEQRKQGRYKLVYNKPSRTIIAVPNPNYKPVCQQPVAGDVISMIQSVNAGHTISLGEAKQRLSACQQPVCDTCEGTGKVYDARLGKGPIGGPTPQREFPCPACQQPPEKTTCKICGKAVTDPDGIHTCQQQPAGEFTRELRKHLEEEKLRITGCIEREKRKDKEFTEQLGDDYSGHCKTIIEWFEGELNWVNKYLEACDRIESLEAESIRSLEIAETHNRLREKWYNKWLGVGKQLAKRGEAIKWIVSHEDGKWLKWLENNLKRILGDDFERITKGVENAI